MNSFKAEVLKRFRGKYWNQEILALVMGISGSRISSILSVSTKRLPIQIAMNLAAALGESAGFWLDAYSAVIFERLRDDPAFQLKLVGIRERLALFEERKASGKTRHKSELRQLSEYMAMNYPDAKGLTLVEKITNTLEELDVPATIRPKLRAEANRA